MGVGRLVKQIKAEPDFVQQLLAEEDAKLVAYKAIGQSAVHIFQGNKCSWKTADVIKVAQD